MGIEWNYEVDGRKLGSMDEFIDALGKKALAGGMKELEQRVKRDVCALRCPVHGESPRITSSKITGNRLHTEFATCCQDMHDKAQRVAAGG